MNVKDVLLARKSKPFNKEEINLIEKAFNFSQKAHQNQKRKSGEPYFNHCYQTALKLAQWQLDTATIVAGLLHDTAEDTNIPLESIKNEFGEEIAFLVDGVTKISHLKYRDKNDQQAENIRKMILALSKDIRVIFIKLADRLHNMKTLSYLPSQKQKRIALETAEIYAPLAYRLGMANLAGELEDSAFFYLHPLEYEWLKKNIKDKYEKREKYLEKVKLIAEKILKENNIKPIKIDCRTKRYSSLYKKLFKVNMNLDEVYDLVALRIIVKTIEECYGALGIIHQLWAPLPGKIKDYIALPKPNGYQSIHTTVFCIDNKPTEFQIRTEEMHQKAENGIAAYWAYSQAKKTRTYQKSKPIFADQKEIVIVEQLRNWQKEFSDPKESIQSLKIDILEDQIFALTPKGIIINLPLGSTPVDFAYTIHSDIGNQCIGAKINNKIVPLDYQLQSGDLVEILIQKNKKPSESWLEFVKTSLAKKHIKSSIRKSVKSIIGNLNIAELKLVVEDKIGLLKDISSIISKNHINIKNINTLMNKGQNIIKIRCEADKEKAEKLILKLKKIKEIKEISYRLV